MRYFGYIPDDFDPRDYRYHIPAKAILPKAIDLICAPVRDQAQENSCGPCALSSHLEALQIANYHKNYTVLSPQFLYYEYRRLYADINSDEGCMLRGLMKVASKQGVCRESLWPYRMDTFAVAPNNICYTDAQDRQLLKYFSIKGDMEMMHCIASGYGFICGIPVFESIDRVGLDGIVPDPEPGEKLEGYHAIYVHGYHQEYELYKFQNSWSSDWGKTGHGYLSFNYMKRADDCWTARRMEDYP